MKAFIKAHCFQPDLLHVRFHKLENFYLGRYRVIMTDNPMKILTQCAAVMKKPNFIPGIIRSVWRISQQILTPV